MLSNDLAFWPAGGEAPLLIRGHHRTEPPPTPASRANRPEILLAHGVLTNRVKLAQRLSLAANSSIASVIRELFISRRLETPGLLEGTLSFALWLPTEGRIVAVADRVGASPLFYSRNQDGLAIGRSARRVAEWANRLEPNPSAVAPFLCSFDPPPGESFYSGVKMVPVAHLLEVTDAGVRLSEYWRLESVRCSWRLEDASAVQETREALGKIVAEYLPQEGLGVTLSGGLDSTAVAAAARLGRPEQRIVALRAVYERLPEIDESDLSESTARHLDLVDEVVEASHLWPLSSENPVPVPADSPFMTPYPEWIGALFARARQRGVTCLLLGIGGDNLFGGFVRPYSELLLRGCWRTLKQRLDVRSEIENRTFPGLLWSLALRPTLSRFGRPLKRMSWTPEPWLGATARESVHARGAIPPTRWRMSPSRESRYRLLTDGFLPPVIRYLAQVGDRFGIEVRNPLCDHRLQELAWSFPTDLGYRAPKDKWVLRQALTGLLPPAVLRAPKSGMSQLARDGFQRRTVSKVRFLTDRMRAADFGFVEPGPLRENLAGFERGQHTRTEFWPALCLELWLRQHF